MTEHNQNLSLKNNFEKRLYTTIKWSVFLILLIPLIVAKDFLGGSNFPYLFPKALFFQSFTEIIFFLWIILALINKSFRPNWRHPVLVFTTLFITLLSFTQIFSQDLHASFWSTQNSMNGLFQYWHFWMWLIVLSSVFKTWHEWKKFFLISIGVATIVNLFSLFEWIGSADRTTSTLGNALHLSTYLIIQFFLPLILWTKETNKHLKAFYIFASIFTLLIIYSTGSRSSLLAILPTAFLALILLKTGWYNFAQKIFKQKKKLLLSVIVIGFIVSSTMIISLNTTSGRAWSLNNLPATTNRILTAPYKDRAELWSIAISGASNHIIAGWGLENFSIPFNLNFDTKKYPTLQEPWYQEAHNHYLDILIASGLIGLISLLTMFVAVFFALFSKTTSNENNKTLLLLTLAIVAQLIQNLFLFQGFIQNVFMFFLFGTIIFLTPNSTIPLFPKTKTSLKENNNYKYLIIPFGFLLVCSIAKINIQPFQEDISNFSAQKELFKSNYSEAKTLYQKSIPKSSIYQSDNKTNFADKIITIDLLYGIDSPSFKDLTDISVKDMQDEIQKNPTKIKTALAAAWLTTINIKNKPDTIESAKEFTQILETLGPKRQEVFELWSMIALENNNNTEALAWLDKAEDVAHTDLATNRITFEKSATVAGQGNYLQAMQLLEQAQTRNYPILSQTTLVNQLAKGILINKNLPTELELYVAEVVNRHSKSERTLESATIIFHHTNKIKERNIVLKALSKLNPTKSQNIKDKLNIKI
jgi:O-antigen ligase/type III secretion system FlhB-like substrate exporter